MLLTTSFRMIIWISRVVTLEVERYISKVMLDFVLLFVTVFFCSIKMFFNSYYVFCIDLCDNSKTMIGIFLFLTHVVANNMFVDHHFQKLSNISDESGNVCVGAYFCACNLFLFDVVIFQSFVYRVCMFPSVDQVGYPPI
ncbi:hypothetical protein HanPI659440_Chr08g0294261 [Helianthus annuus]|nr:hypothetical protein HanPI659440_Chr08g0294261 [Helianthus annuus]